MSDEIHLEVEMMVPTTIDVVIRPTEDGHNFEFVGVKRSGVQSTVSEEEVYNDEGALESIMDGLKEWRDST